MVFNRKSDARPAISPLNEPTPLNMRSAPEAEIANVQQTKSGDAPLGGYAALPESVIGNDFTIEGNAITIRCKGSLRINGNIDASLHARKLVVGETATINGAITAESVTVHGRVSGAINGERVVLGRSAKVEGDIASRFLEIEPGADFEGRSRKVKDVADIAPQLEPVLPAGGTPVELLTPPEPRTVS